MIDLTSDEADDARERFERALKLGTRSQLSRAIMKRNGDGYYDNDDIRLMFDGWVLKTMADKECGNGKT